MTVLGPARARLEPAAMAALAVVALGSLALATRPHAWRSMATLGLVAAIGLIGRVPAARPSAAPATWLAVIALGVAAFAVVRAGSVAIPVAFTLAGAGAQVLAAVSEEAFFRRYAYGWLVRHGAPIAIVVTAVLFAVVHVPQYGVAALPLNLAAGLLLGWQRWATGSWTAPAVTHAAANLLQMG